MKRLLGFVGILLIAMLPAVGFASDGPTTTEKATEVVKDFTDVSAIVNANVVSNIVFKVESADYAEAYINLSSESYGIHTDNSIDVDIYVETEGVMERWDYNCNLGYYSPGNVFLSETMFYRRY